MEISKSTDTEEAMPPNRDTVTYLGKYYGPPSRIIFIQVSKGVILHS